MKKWVVILSAVFLQSCSYQFFVPKERVIHEETGFLLFAGNNDYFIPYKLKKPVGNDAQQYIVAKYLNSSAYLVKYNEEILSELKNVYGTPFSIENKSSKSLTTREGYRDPKDSIYYLIPVELLYYVPKAILKMDLYTEIWMRGNETIEFKYKSEGPHILSITPYFTEERQYYLQNIWYNSQK